MVGGLNHMGDAEDEEEAPSKDFAICGLDVVAALCEALEGNILPEIHPLHILLFSLS